MKKLILSFLVMMALSPMVIAQSTITGRIVDESNKQGVPFVNVGLFRVSDTAFISGAASDDRGAFMLQAVPSGEMLLKISAIGYELFEMPVTVKGNMDLGALKLIAGTTRLDEVVITEKRPMFLVEGEKTMYNVAEDPSIQTGTLSDALQNAPGVEVDVEGNITLRGTSSVEVWINDKPSHMSSENLKTYIQQLPANSLDRVEVITNPSARYGSKADGIINIVTNAKVQKNEFFSFGVNGSTRPSVTPWFSYVWSSDKLTVNAYLNGGYSIWEGKSTTDQSLFIEGHASPASHEIDSAAYQSKGFNGGGYVSVDYEIDTANSLNFWISGWPNWGGSNSNSRSSREVFLNENGLPLFNPLMVDYRTISNSKSFNYFVNGGVYYQHKFDNKGHNLSVSADAMGWGYNGSGRVVRQFELPNEYMRVINSAESRNSFGGEVEIVYNRPYSENGEISVGWNTGFSPETVYSKRDTLAGEEWVNDAFRSYQATFTTLTNEAFITVQHKFGGFTVKPGIRFCHEVLRGSYVDSTQYNFSKPFFSVRPSLHLSYRTASMHNFSLSYTRRIAAPEAHELSMFPLYEEDEFSTGNPDLDRIYTNAFEAGWTKYFMNFGSIGLSAYYRGKSNEVNEIQMSVYHPLFGRVVPYSYPVNVGKSHTAGFEYNMMYRPNGFFNLRFYANLYNSYIATQFNGTDVVSNMWSYSFRLNLWAKLWNRVEVTASGYYSSPTQSLFSERHARYGIDAGLRADFFDRKMSVFVNASDIFNWNSWGMSNASPYVASSSSSKFNSRAVSVGLTFRFGKMELEKMARQGADDSQGAPQGMGGM